MAAISQKEYLKKYLSGKKKDGTKKKKRPKVIGQGIKIIDEEYDLSKMRELHEAELDIYGHSEDAPQIVGIIDDRPEEIIKQETFTTKKWKVINEDDGFNSSVKIEQTKNRSKGMNAANSDSDLSPPRDRKEAAGKHNKSNSDSDLSPPRQRKHNNDSDLSPPRKKKHNNDSDLSPPRKKRQNSDSDMSPPRRKNRNDDFDISPLRKKKQYDSDLSPARVQKRKSNKNDSDSDLSPAREKPRDKHNKNKDRNRDHIPSERRDRDHQDKRHNQSRNNEPRRKSRWDNDDRRSKDYEKKSYDVDSKNRDDRTRDKHRDDRTGGEKATKTLEGKMAGLQNANQLRTENADLRKREDELFGKLSEDLTGRNAQAIKRNIRRGREETEADMEKKKEQEAYQKMMEEKYTRWGKGLKQVEDHESRVQEFIHEASKPFARHRDDEDLDRTLKDRERIGDPMMEYMKRKEMDKAASNNEVIRPIYHGAYPINRFNIRPGHRWDGVDRSNGYEKSYFETINNRKAQEEETYKWSVEDM